MPTLEQARRWYVADDPVHGFEHVLRVYRLAGRLARAEGAAFSRSPSAVCRWDSINEPSPFAAAAHWRAAVESQASGVLFTANPLTGLRSETVIEATLGLGEAAQVYGAWRDGNLAKSGVRILKHPSGQMALAGPRGIVMTGKPAAVMGRYHSIMSARARGFGEMITVESGLRGQPWMGEADA